VSPEVVLSLPGTTSRGQRGFFLPQQQKYKSLCPANDSKAGLARKRRKGAPAPTMLTQTGKTTKNAQPGNRRGRRRGRRDAKQEKTLQYNPTTPKHNTRIKKPAANNTRGRIRQEKRAESGGSNGRTWKLGGDAGRRSAGATLNHINRVAIATKGSAKGASSLTNPGWPTYRQQKKKKKNNGPIE
jgi:hypothetical protein